MLDNDESFSSLLAFLIRNIKNLLRRRQRHHFLQNESIAEKRTQNSHIYVHPPASSYDSMNFSRKQ